MEQILFNHSQKPTSRPPSHRRGFLNLGFELNGQGRSIMRHWERRAPLIVQQELYFDREMPLLPCVYILSSGGPILSSDSFEQHFSLKRGAMAHISTGAATKVAEMNGGSAQMRTYIRLENEAYLEYLPQPTIPCRGVDSSTIRTSQSRLRQHYSGQRYTFRGVNFMVRASSLGSWIYKVALRALTKSYSSRSA